MATTVRFITGDELELVLESENADLLEEALLQHGPGACVSIWSEQEATNYLVAVDKILWVSSR